MVLYDVRASRAVRDTVAVLSPHAALGRDWDTVIIAGVQEGLWPNILPRGGVLGTILSGMAVYLPLHIALGW